MQSFLTRGGRGRRTLDDIKQFTTLIGTGTRLTGTLRSNENCIVNGDVEGDCDIEGVLVLGEVSMAIVARIMPQMNMFVAAFPVKIFLGIVTMALSFPLLVSYMGATTQQSFDLVFRFLRVH